tara:strand:+ start:34 stop:255 length:222 start_codon:yes stop_codon:yes gene_type:complete
MSSDDWFTFSACRVFRCSVDSQRGFSSDWKVLSISLLIGMKNPRNSELVLNPGGFHQCVHWFVDRTIPMSGTA